MVSDWSSDVCSSDLGYHDGVSSNPGIARGGFGKAPFGNNANVGAGATQIGRASCRERV